MPRLTDPDPLIRLTPMAYADGVSAMGPTGDAAQIAAQVFDQDGDMPNFAGLSALMVVWGQFIDHDLDLTRDASGEFEMVEGLVAPFQRSVFEPFTDGPRQQINEITPALDASMVYGSTSTRTEALRLFEGGQLMDGVTDAGGRMMMPLSSEENFMAGMEAAGGPVFLAGDIRANENLALTAVHTVMAREHNHWAEVLEKRLPDLEDAALFQMARAIVEYEIQSITYRDWLPHLLGDTPLAASADAPETLQVSTEFSTAAFRLGHTMVPTAVRSLTEEGKETEETPLKVQDIFFNPGLFDEAVTIDQILRGQMATFAQEIDGKIIDDLNFFLKAPDGLTGFSLAALNILRGRDHGIDGYLDVRAHLLGDVDPETAGFDAITSDLGAQAALAAVYDSARDVDLWVGGLIEDKPAGAQLGPTFSHILADQFFRAREYDDGFGTLPEGLPDDLRGIIEDSTLGDIIARTTGITHLADDVFLTMDRVPGSEFADGMVAGAGAEMIFAGAGDDTVFGGGGDDLILGDAGVDTATYMALRSSYLVALDADEITVTDKRAMGDGHDTLKDIETLAFLDGDWTPGDMAAVFALSEDDVCALIELYVAYFGRAPDATGLLFWAGQLADGMALGEIGAYFYDQDETRALYPDDGDNAGFAASVYSNVLGREGDGPGLSFWTGVLDSGAVARADFVGAFLAGVQAGSADAAHLKDKVDIGIYFGVTKGMGDMDNAAEVMALYDGTATGMQAAADKIGEMFEAAMAEGSDAYLLSLPGLAEDPFAVV